MSLTLPQPRLIEPSSVPALRWGVIGTGIGTQFTTALHSGTPQRVVAIAARDAVKTAKIAGELGVPRVHAHSSALIDDPDVDVIYIATPHTMHRDLALEAIAAGKHVLVEKPIAATAADARIITDAARAAGVLAMEAMWTRYLPQTDILQQILADGLLGPVRLVRAEFGPKISFDPASRYWNAELGGGALLDAGIYPIAFASAVLGRPMSIAAVGTIGDDGVDTSANILITANGDAAALLSTSIVTSMPAGAMVAGSEGRVEFAPRFFAPTGMTVTIGPWGAQQVASWQPDIVDDPGHGYAFQATALAAYVAEGRVESPLHTHDETVSILATIDEVRRQLREAARAASPPSSPENGARR